VQEAGSGVGCVCAGAPSVAGPAACDANPCHVSGVSCCSASQVGSPVLPSTAAALRVEKPSVGVSTFQRGAWLSTCSSTHSPSQQGASPGRCCASVQAAEQQVGVRGPRLHCFSVWGRGLWWYPPVCGGTHHTRV
jgi:hypothetical protein